MKTAVTLTNSKNEYIEAIREHQKNPQGKPGTIINQFLMCSKIYPIKSLYLPMFFAELIRILCQDEEQFGLVLQDEDGVLRKYTPCSAERLQTSFMEWNPETQKKYIRILKSIDFIKVRRVGRFRYFWVNEDSMLEPTKIGKQYMERD